MILAGVDLAWKNQNNSTGMAFGSLKNNVLKVIEIFPTYHPIEEIKKRTEIYSNFHGIAIDAPLIIKNISGQRTCETELGRSYGSKSASCHTSNLSLYPNALSSKISHYLESVGFEHLNKDAKWQIECYPHPAIIEFFGLCERLRYKKGNLTEKRQGQFRLASYLLALSKSQILRLEISDDLKKIFDEENIFSLNSNDLKINEDCLDAVVCLCTAGIFSLHESPDRIFGNKEYGYIYVPQIKCI